MRTYLRPELAGTSGVTMEQVLSRGAVGKGGVGAPLPGSETE